jgi:hypothetical protein
MPADLSHTALVEAMARGMMDADLGHGAFDDATFQGAEAEREAWRCRARAALAALLQAAGVTAEDVRTSANELDDAADMLERVDLERVSALLCALAGEGEG